ncbi:MAG TPA: GNAT family N-acetyltransferase [Bacteroidota bacterium]|nr:GNAT family N-acetyltransferase [Bacteroidota bacterium]
MKFRIRRTKASDARRVRAFVREHWGDETIVAHGVVFQPEKLKGFVAEIGRAEWIGLATYHIRDLSCELVSLNSIHEGEGVGTALVRAVAEESFNAGCSRLRCVTTNDNFPALIFYQKRGFRIIAVHPGAVERARILKPSIPLWGIESIPIRDEIELELRPDENHN